LRSAIQATDCTWSGCRAKSPATKSERQGAPVSRNSAANRSPVEKAWTTTLVAWKPAGSSPWSSTSAMRDSQTSGIQLASWMAVNAQVTPSRVSPPWTTGLAVTYLSSS
jgi:hypothetical protein